MLLRNLSSSKISRYMYMYIQADASHVDKNQGHCYLHRTVKLVYRGHLCILAVIKKWPANIIWTFGRRLSRTNLQNVTTGFTVLLMATCISSLFPGYALERRPDTYACKPKPFTDNRFEFFFCVYLSRVTTISVLKRYL